jgi:hypothetical protein
MEKKKTTETEIVKEVVQPEINETDKLPRSDYRRGKYFGLIIILALVVVGVLGYFGYKFYSYRPAMAISQAFDKSMAAESLVAEFRTPGDNFLARFNYHKDNLSELKLEFSPTGEELEVYMVGDKRDIYLQMSYSGLDKLIDQLYQTNPYITSLNTYKLILPALQGEEWIHVLIPTKSSNLDNSQTPTPIPEYEELKSKFLQSLSFREYQRNYKMSGVVYERISIGIKKDKLIDFLESIKDTDLDIKLSDINSAITFVKSVDNWDSDLAEILIEKKTGLLRKIVFKLPEIPDGAIEKVIDDSKPDSNVSKLRNFSQSIENFISQSPKGELNEIGTLTFDSYDDASDISRPINVIESEVLLEAASQELMPLLYGSMGNSPIPNY